VDTGSAYGMIFQGKQVPCVMLQIGEQVALGRVIVKLATQKKNFGKKVLDKIRKLSLFGGKGAD